MSTPENYRYILPHEIALHNKPTDCWVCIWRKVYDITELIQTYGKSKLIRPLVLFAGKDISHWFNPITGDLNTCIDPKTGVLVSYLPHGSIPDSSYVPAYPTSVFETSNPPPWWKTDKYFIGLMTKRVRLIKIFNMLTSQVLTLKVCSEDTLNEIAERLKPFNSRPHEYIWRLLDGTTVDMNKTLEENGLPDESERLAELDVPAGVYIPFIKLDFKDERGMSDDSDSDDSSETSGNYIARKFSVRYISKENLPHIYFHCCVLMPNLTR